MCSFVARQLINHHQPLLLAELQLLPTVVEHLDALRPRRDGPVAAAGEFGVHLIRKTMS
jgi:hypothetical protein